MRYRFRPATLALALAGLTVAPPPPAAGQDRFDAAIEQVLPRITEIRHRIHANPELGNREVETAALVAGHLRGLGFDDVRTGIAHTGVVAVLRGGRPGPVVAVRADMDALPVTEATDLPFASTKRTTYLGQDVGVMHACGHDIHTAVQLGVAAVLKGLQAELPGTVVFVFQPAEEGPPPGEEGGAKLMLEEGVFRDPRPEAVFGLHASAHADVGRVAYTPGGALAAVDHFRATIRGRQAHGAAPHLSIDPVVMAAQAVTALQTIRSRNLSPLAPSVVTVGLIRGGHALQHHPGRGADRGDGADVRSGRSGHGGAPHGRDPRRHHAGRRRLFRARLRPHHAGHHQRSPADRRDRAEPRRRGRGGERRAGGSLDGGEDFSLFANEVPGFFFMLGARKPGTVSGDHHSPTFRADDGALPVGMRAMANVVWDYLERGGR